MQSQIFVGANDDSECPFVASATVQRPPEITMSDANHQAYLRERGITGYDIETTLLETPEAAQKLKNAFRLYFPCLMANIIKVLLFKKEEKLACLLTAYYELSLD